MPAISLRTLRGENSPWTTGFLSASPKASLIFESVFQLEPGQQLTLLTDGVPEARNSSGELYGFTRTAAISVQSAAAIALAAHAFGREVHQGPPFLAKPQIFECRTRRSQILELHLGVFTRQDHTVRSATEGC